MSSSHNRNPKGVNQYAPVPTANDPVLKAALESYHRQGLTSNKRISELLKADHNIDIKDSAVKRRRKELSLMGSRVTTATMPYDDALQLILSEMDDDICCQGTTSGRPNPRLLSAYTIVQGSSEVFPPQFTI